MARSNYFLCIGDTSIDDAERYTTLAAAKDRFWMCAVELARYGGPVVQATLHIAERRDEVVEYPDFVLSLGPRQGVRMERC